MTDTDDQDPSRADQVSRQIEVRATPQRVWSLVSDLPSMGAYSPENTGGDWVGEPGARLGAVFTGRNAHGSKSWSTRSTVVACEPGRSFGFDVRAVGMPVARWSYEIAPSGEDGCLLTETWQDRRGKIMHLLGRVSTGVSDRRAFTVASIEQTLEKVRSVAEQEVSG